MAILRVLSGAYLPCGCLAGVYEGYDGSVLAVIDARGDDCPDRGHLPGAHVELPYEGSLAFCRAATATTPERPINPTRFGNT
jgi:hypothetical protein